MIEKTTALWKKWFATPDSDPVEEEAVPIEKRVRGEVRELDMAPDDPLLAYFLNDPEPVLLDQLQLDSPMLTKLKKEGYSVIVPLVSQGELIGLLNLGPRLSEQRYSSEDLRLLNNLATQASPALRVAQLARQQLAEAQRRERIEHELQVARIIQETLLPEDLPQLPGWKVAAHWQPARAVGGDFYDFIHLSDDRLGIIVADVTDKGVPAAMVMATTRSLVRATAEKIIQPGEVLARTNELLYPDIPPKMFVTCLYLILDLDSGQVHFANAGHNLPYLQTGENVQELRATGMPLGLMEDMVYEEQSFTIEQGESLLLSSDGLVEAHNEHGEMFGFPRVQRLLGEKRGGEELIGHLLLALRTFTGEDHEQEDDITLVAIERRDTAVNDDRRGDGSRALGKFSVPSKPGNERLAIDHVLEAIQPLNLPEQKIKRLETAVGEAAMNAMEHGNNYRPDLPVDIQVATDGESLSVSILDHGKNKSIPDSTKPDLPAKISGEQSPRGWGLYLIANMVDDMKVSQKDGKRSVELVIELE